MKNSIIILSSILLWSCTNEGVDHSSYNPSILTIQNGKLMDNPEYTRYNVKVENSIYVDDYFQFTSSTGKFNIGDTLNFNIK